MHGLLVTFKSAKTLEQLAEPLQQAASEICDVPGLISKAWLHQGESIGGFYLFTSRQAADDYLAPTLAELGEVPAFSEIEVRHFAVLDELSVQNGTPASPLADRRDGQRPPEAGLG